MQTSDLSLGDKYWVCPLYSFNCNCESVDLAEGIRIIKLPDFLRPDDYEDSEYSYGPPWSKEGCVEYIAALPSQAYGTKKVREDFNRAINLLYDVISALRLCHEGMVTAGELEHLDRSGSTTGLESFRPDTDLFTITKFNRPLQPEYMFSQSDIPKVNELIVDIRKTSKIRGMNIALRRLNSSYSSEPEGKLIDQMIAFESLYIADDRELGYKLALRTAFLLGKHRLKIFNEMKKAYNLRGQIVHGSKQVERIKLKNIIPKTEEYLRQSISKFLFLLSHGMSLKEVRDKLDDNILKSGKILAIKE